MRLLTRAFSVGYRTVRRAQFAVLSFQLLQALVNGEVAGQAAPRATIVYVVRHAERASDHPTDPSLTAEGSARAEGLARMLGEAGITDLHATSYRRTRLTAAPLAARLAVEVQEYSADGQSALAERIRRSGGRHVVVGHSNTVPQLVTLLGGEAGEPIADDEYDRLYLVLIDVRGVVTTALLRYGSARVPPALAGAAASRPAHVWTPQPFRRRVDPLS